MHTDTNYTEAEIFERRQEGLAALLGDCFDNSPSNKGGRDRYGDYSFIAKELGITRQSVSGWVKRGSIPGNRAQQIVQIKGCRVKIEQFSKYF